MFIKHFLLVLVLIYNTNATLYLSNKITSLKELFGKQTVSSDSPITQDENLAVMPVVLHSSQTKSGWSNKVHGGGYASAYNYQDHAMPLMNHNSYQSNHMINYPPINDYKATLVASYPVKDYNSYQSVNSFPVSDSYKGTNSYLVPQKSVVGNQMVEVENYPSIGGLVSSTRPQYVQVNGYVPGSYVNMYQSGTHGLHHGVNSYSGWNQEAGGTYYNRYG